MKDEKSIKTNAVQERKAMRYFSEQARKAIVSEIEAGLSKAEAARKYKVSKASIYKWLQKYSDKYRACLVTVVEHESDSQKNKALQKELSEVYELLGRLQAETMLLQQVIEQANTHFETDLKKTFAKAH